ncbi:ABC transporter [Nostoc cf. commune SO-36]|uniref:ABC transporter n=1 Tax=Nostoc cf. commune SO-36 TaxID=449208 RepID=A0ABM7Z6P4_NOSCO|nr:restriction system-associated AAA family ATPase [Nostoc commune]BDI18776.1 ABC transporter [Nostoc cf. commune SO-36]
MKLLRVHIISAKTCGGLLDGLNLQLRSPFNGYSGFAPLCLIGPNGAGKSQFLQVLTEIFQSVFHRCIPDEERVEGNPDLLFELEYLIHPEDEQLPVRVRISQKASGKNRPTLLIERRDEDEYDWIDCDLNALETHTLLPQKIVGYTSGDNETLSLPFLLSRSGYAKDVTESALKEPKPVPDTRLMLIDYGTHLEVFVANLLLGEASQWDFLLKDAKLQNLHSFRCVVQLAHSAAPNNPNTNKGKPNNRPKEVLLTEELKTYLDQFKRCATCYSYDDRTKTYTFDYWINDHTREGFRLFWDNTLDLYSSFHKFAMLNDLVLPKKTRERFRKDTKSRRFASRLPEPQDEDKVFRFESVMFTAQRTGKEVDYVSLSDGEHQLGQILGTFCMLSFPNVLFLLDEPESHFNPLWRVKFISRILDLPTIHGDRRESAKATEQECLLTTHSPFVPSDMHRDKVFIFSKDEEGKIQVQNPNIETFGTTFDTIIEECFNVRPPMSQVPHDEIKRLMESENPEEIRAGMQHLGDSVEKAFLVDRLLQLTNRDEV